MIGMILSAGFGTRLRPLTDEKPKALIEHKGKPMIAHQVARLIAAGVEEIVVNAHHFAEQIEVYFKNNLFDVPITVVREKEILGTGGGIMNGSHLLKKHNKFIVINVDVDTDFDISNMVNAFGSKEIAMLAVQKRNTSRALEFNDKLELIGKENEETIEQNKYGFNGIHIISSRIFEYNYSVVFSGIIEVYFDLIKKGEIIKGFDTGNCTFKDLGKTENLE